MIRFEWRKSYPTKLYAVYIAKEDDDGGGREGAGGRRAGWI